MSTRVLNPKFHLVCNTPITFPEDYTAGTTAKCWSSRKKVFPVKTKNRTEQEYAQLSLLNSLQNWSWGLHRSFSFKRLLKMWILACSHETVLTLRKQKYINIGSNSSTTSYIINSRIKYCQSSFLLSNHFLTCEKGREDEINPAYSSLSTTYTALCLKTSKVWLSLNLVLPKNTSLQVLQFPV